MFIETIEYGKRVWRWLACSEFLLWGYRMAVSRSYGIGVLCVFVAALAWSTAGLFTRIVTTDIPTTLLWRSIFGGGSVLLIYYVMNRPESFKELVRFKVGEFIIALISALGMMCFISAFFFTSIANVSFVYGVMPLVTMLIAWLVLRDPLTVTGLVSTVLSGLGVAVLVWEGQHFGDLLGIGLAFLMAFFMAAVTVAAKFFPDADAMKSAYLSGFIAAILVLPFSRSMSASSHDLVWLALYGLANVGFGFGVYLLGVARVPALAAALIGLSEIPLAPIWALLLFGERITIPMAIGGSLVLIASVAYILASTTQKPRMTEPRPATRSHGCEFRHS